MAIFVALVDTAASARASVARTPSASSASLSNVKKSVLRSCDAIDESARKSSVARPPGVVKITFRGGETGASGDGSKRGCGRAASSAIAAATHAAQPSRAGAPALTSRQRADSDDDGDTSSNNKYAHAATTKMRKNKFGRGSAEPASAIQKGGPLWGRIHGGA
jgi:hypothetical protein